MNEEDIRKNVHDLEYQHLLNMQNIVLGLIGATLITVLFLSELPEKWPVKSDILFLLIILGLFFFLYFQNKLKEKVESIKKILEKKK